MKKSGLIFKWLVTVFLCLFLLSGCALWDKFFSAEDEDEAPHQLMSEGMESLEGGYYDSATKAFEKIRDRYPYSRFAMEAELKLADALYKKEEYEEAYEAYDDFERMHPKNQYIPYVIYQKGMCHFGRKTTIDREQVSTHRAKEEFERLVNRYKSGEYVEKARTRIRECYVSLAEYELYVGHFYFKMGKYRAAMDRYRYLIEHYPDLGQYHEALEYYRICKERLPEEEVDEAEEGWRKKTSWWSRLYPWNWWGDDSEEALKEKRKWRKKTSWWSRLYPWNWWGDESEASEQMSPSEEKRAQAEAVREHEEEKRAEEKIEQPQPQEAEEKTEKEQKEKNKKEEKSSWWSKLNPWNWF